MLNPDLWSLYPHAPKVLFIKSELDIKSIFWDHYSPITLFQSDYGERKDTSILSVWYYQNVIWVFLRIAYKDFRKNLQFNPWSLGGTDMVHKKPMLLSTSELQGLIGFRIGSWSFKPCLSPLYRECHTQVYGYPLH